MKNRCLLVAGAALAATLTLSAMTALVSAEDGVATRPIQASLRIPARSTGAFRNSFRRNQATSPICRHRKRRARH